jgi:hypothetical protein
MDASTTEHSGLGRGLAFLVLGFGVSLLANVFFLQGRALYLHQLGAAALPSFYMAFNVVAIIIGVGLFVRNVPAKPGLQVVLLGMAGVLAVSAEAMANPGPQMAIGLAFTSSLFLMTASLFYWNCVSQAFTIREIERWGQYLSAASLCGAIGAGLAMPLFHALPTAVVCGGSAGLMAVAAVAIRSLPVAPRRAPLSGTGELMPMELFRTDLINLLLILTALMGIIRYLSEYQFSHLLVENLHGAAAISAFTGKLQAIVSSVTLIWQVFFLRRVLNSWRVTNLYLYSSIALVVTTASPLLWPGLGVLAMQQGLMNFLGKAIRQPSQNIVVKVMPSTLTSQANFLLSGLAESVTALVAAVLIAALAHYGASLRVFFVIGSVLSVLMVVTAVRLPFPYVSMLVRRLQREGSTPGATLIDG